MKTNQKNTSSPTQPPVRLAAYCRVSTEKDEQLESLENQKRFFAEFSKRYGYQLVNIYADEGISGKQMANRKAFLQLLEDAKNHLFDLVVVKDISRFSRNTVDFLNAIRQLKALQIEVQFLSNNQTVLGNSEFILTIFSALAQEESANLSKRVRFGKRMNAKKGRVPNLIYGYDQADTFTLIINEQEAQVVREIFARYLQQGQGSRRIALDLTAQGIPSKKGMAWTPKTIRRMLQNPIYCGILENNKYETVDFLTGKQTLLPPEEHYFHERPQLAIISKEWFDRAQQMIAQRQTQYAGEVHHAGRYSSRHLFSTLIRCEQCGYAYGRSSYTYKNTYIKWKCTGNNQYTSAFCPNNFVLDEAELIVQLEQYLLEQIGDQSLFVRQAEQIYRQKAVHAEAGADVRLVQTQLDRLNAARNRCKQLYINGMITMEELQQKLTASEEQCNRLQKQLDAPVSTPEPLDAETILNGLRLSQWNNTDLREILERITVDQQGNVTVYWKQIKAT